MKRLGMREGEVIGGRQQCHGVEFENWKGGERTREGGMEGGREEGGGGGGWFVGERESRGERREGRGERPEGRRERT